MAETLEQRLREGHAVPGCDCWLCKLLIEAADALAAMSCPEGWKMVPVEPTDGMWKAGDASLEPYWRNGGKADCDPVWRAMLDASPPLPHPMGRRWAMGDVLVPGSISIHGLGGRIKEVTVAVRITSLEEMDLTLKVLEITRKLLEDDAAPLPTNRETLSASADGAETGAVLDCRSNSSDAPIDSDMSSERAS
jgi:hypothetical protein